MGTEAVRFLVLWMAGWIHSRQLEVIDFLREENRILREQLGGRRLRFTDDQRRRLAAKGWIVGRRRLGEFAGLVTPDTILRWYRKLIARWAAQLLLLACCMSLRSTSGTRREGISGPLAGTTGRPSVCHDGRRGRYRTGGGHERH
jgi:hypothetical protein